jgi:hypothetical protein
MPQPLSRVLPNAGVWIGNVGDYPLARHPGLALLAAEVIASWSNVEAFMLRLFVELMGGSADIAATVFLALENQSAKTAAINAASRRLPEEQRRLLHALLAIAKTQQKSRDKIAHWTWGDSPQLPDALLLLDPRTSVTDDRLSNDDVYVYKERDFVEIIRANERLAGFGMTFKFILMGHVANGDGQLFAQLCDEPEIRERLSREASRSRPGNE